jgi:hypothetical protein
MAALYGPEYPLHYAFDILTGSIPNPSYDPNESRDNSEQILAVTRAIVYTDKHYRNWESPRPDRASGILHPGRWRNS